MFFAGCQTVVQRSSGDLALWSCAILSDKHLWLEKLSQVSWCQKLHFLKGSFGSGSKSESIPTDSGKKSNFTAEINLLTARHEKLFVYIANIIFYADVLIEDQFEFH